MTTEIWSVSELVYRCRQLLEQGLGSLWVEGEVSGLVRHQSGHLYFNLKDAKASLKCVMFRLSALRLKQQPDNGTLVRVRVKTSLYEARGELQFIADQLEPAGLGQLQQAFLALQQRLHQEGLFASQRKKALPRAPKRVALITSPTGAALQDVLKVLKHRAPWIELRVYPCLVQGELAVNSILRALAWAIDDGFAELLVLCRGGGSYEDLFCFNDERLVRAIAACPLPTLTGIGHEIDLSLADLAADQRAATPSAAAELLSPDQQYYLSHFQQLEQRLRQGVSRQQQHCLQRLKLRRQRLRAQHPEHRLRQLWFQLDDTSLKLTRYWQQQQRQRQYRLNLSQVALEHLHPLKHLQQQRNRLEQLQQRQQRQLSQQLQHYQLQQLGLQQRLQRLQFGQRLTRLQQDLHGLRSALLQAQQQRQQQQQQQQLDLQQRLQRVQFGQRLTRLQQDLHGLRSALLQAQQQRLHQQQQILAALVSQLQQLSPLQTLARGYSISQQQQQLIHSVHQLSVGQQLTTLVADGRIYSRVESIQAEPLI